LPPSLMALPNYYDATLERAAAGTIFLERNDRILQLLHSVEVQQLPRSMDAARGGAMDWGKGAIQR
jgi:hypothetical protein